MSDVLIRGMEMPKDGAKLYMIAFSNGKACASYKPFEWHEVVSVPPHGDLIDRDLFIEFIKTHWDSYDQWFVEQLEARPTIIEAEEGIK